MNNYDYLLNLLDEELIPALGCTEPIAIALVGAKARDVLGQFPDKIKAEVSGNVLKNVKSVIVPNTDGMRGVDTAAAAGVVGGDASLNLEVLNSLTHADIEKIKALLSEGFCTVEHLKSNEPLHIKITAYKGDSYAAVELKDSHSNVCYIEKDGVVLLKTDGGKCDGAPKREMALEDIYDFARTVKLDDVRPVISRQIKCNTAICQEGLKNSYGQNIGKTLLSIYGNDIKVTARALASAGSDARMSGCSLPVIINSGSGNQGITVSIPVIEFARALNSNEETLYRALVLSNLVAIYLKRGMGKLSAYCGVVSASCGAGAGITYLHGGDLKTISKTITNTVANVSGIVCDGAKGSCAAKIASSVDACILGHYMAMADNVFRAGDGIVKANVEDTIDGVMKIAKDAMRETDEEILNIMFNDYK